MRLAWLASIRFRRDGALAHNVVDPWTGEVISAAEDQRKAEREHATGYSHRVCARCGSCHAGRWNTCEHCKRAAPSPLNCFDDDEDNRSTRNTLGARAGARQLLTEPGA